MFVSCLAMGQLILSCGEYVSRSVIFSFRGMKVFCVGAVDKAMGDIEGLNVGNVLRNQGLLLLSQSQAFGPSCCCGSL